MGRDSILDNGSNSDQNTNHKSQSSENNDDNDGGTTKLTQRMPDSLVDGVDEVQDEYALPSRNATINFIVKQWLKDNQ